MKDIKKQLFIVLLGLVATSCDSSSVTPLTDFGCQSGLELCGDTCCMPGSCDSDNVCRDSDNDACGADKIECESNQVCQEGRCIAKQEACSAPKKVCEGSCINVAADPLNCGECGNKCDTGESCKDSKCIKGCAEGYTLIDGQCYNTNIDSEHCGNDNVACGAHQFCTKASSADDASCQCMHGYYDCDGDPSNGCESNVSCDYLCEAGNIVCGPKMCCPESATCCGSECCAEGTTCCGEGACYDLQNDPRHCGDCANECKSSEVCMDGVCLPNTEQTCEDEVLCWGKCIDVNTNAEHCGACGNKCDDGFECKDATCIIKCNEGLEACGDTCVDITKDNANCGACGNACAPTTQCVTDDNGTSCKATAEINPELNCAAEEKIECWGECLDGKTDNNNCGACGNKCDDGYACKDSNCVYNCAEGLVACGETCIDVTKDNKNCGACGNACDPTSQCVTDENGTACKPTAEIDPELVCNTEEDLETEGYIPKTECWGKCLDVSNDNDNCGACGNACGDKKECKDGACIDKPIEIDPTTCDAPGYGLCYGACTNLMEDDKNCGECLNACGNGEKCVSGTCELQCGELTKCDDTCIDIQTSANNCGACGNTCAAGQVCVGGHCQCDATHKDCDGNAANGCEAEVEKCECTPKAKQACWRGTAETRNVGACKDGEQTCDASGQFWGPCIGGTYPSAITCNDAGFYLGGDQNCNGIDDTKEDCVSSCDLIRSADSYIGCEYWPVYLTNLPNENVSYKNHTVLVSNPNDKPTDIYIYRENNYNQKSTFIKRTVNPGKVEIIQLSTRLDYMIDTSSSNSPSTIENKSYLLRSSLPITVYQFNPWDGSATYSADASLLLPSNVYGKKYMVMNWAPNTGASVFTSNMTVVAVAPGKTKVTVKSNAAIASGTGIAGMSVGGTQTFELNRFQVLNLTTRDTTVSGREQTGSIISSDKNVAVYSGMKCSQIPHGYTACDHLEEMLFPVQAWGKSYFAVPVEQRGSSPDIWRIVASENNTTVTLPASLGGNIVLNEGQFKQIETAETFEIKADKPISVGQFMVGQSYKNAGKGDPAFGLAVPFEQYRTDYSFSVPSSYNENYVTIIVPNDGTLKYDGAELSTAGFKSIGSSGFKYTYKKVTAGTHTMTGSKAFGLIGYGYSPYISYLYPIGLDLKKLNNTN